MKITPWFAHPQAILDVYDFLYVSSFRRIQSELYKQLLNRIIKLEK